MYLFFFFQTTIEDIGSQLTAYSEKANSLHKQNIELSEELKSVFEKYELREQVNLKYSPFFIR